MIEQLSREQVADEALALQSDPSRAAELAAAHSERVQNVLDLRPAVLAAQPYLPELPEDRASDVYEGVLHFERSLTSVRAWESFKDADRVGLKEYANGFAFREDQLLMFGNGRVLAEAGHATDPVRKSTGKSGPADHGTAGIAGFLAAEEWTRSIVAVGRQTSNTNTDPNHPVKPLIAAQLAADEYSGFLSVHGMRAGKVQHLLDTTELHGVVGLGLHPNEESVAAAEELCRRAAEYGLKVIIGNHHWHLDLQPDASEGYRLPGVSSKPLLGEDGRPVTARLAAYGEDFTTTFASQVEEGRAPINMQLEISRRLRLQPQEYPVRPDVKAEQMAVYLGYHLAELAAGICVERRAIMRP